MFVTYKHANLTRWKKGLVLNNGILLWYVMHERFSAPEIR